LEKMRRLEGERKVGKRIAPISAFTDGTTRAGLSSA